jgi:hypothetical protein
MSGVQRVSYRFWLIVLRVLHDAFISSDTSSWRRVLGDVFGVFLVGKLPVPDPELMDGV